MNDFFDVYLEYTRGGEVPIACHRWSAIVGIGALLERNVSINFGEADIFPNLYAMIIGKSATKKSTAIKRIKKILRDAGYNTFAADKTSKEKYLQDLAAQNAGSEGGDGTDILDRNIFGNVSDQLSTPNFIAADEANDFFGINNESLLSLLGSLWDYEGVYENRIKTGKSDFIPNPTVSILSGNTPTGFSQAFPPAIIGQGFFSRLLLIYSEPVDYRITIPRRPSASEKEELIKLIHRIREQAVGSHDLEVASPIAFKLVDKIYNTYTHIDDTRFEAYSNRRLHHLLKIVLIVSAAKLEKKISEDSVIQANTYLSYAESLMPKALGEFGKAKNSDITHKILNIIETKFPVSLKQIIKETAHDVEKPDDVGPILRKLLVQDKIQCSKVDGLYLPLKKERDDVKETKEGLVDYGKYLSTQEMDVKK